jgi:hypothetical protein
MTDAERFVALRKLLIDVKGTLYEMGFTRHDWVVQRIYAGLETAGPPPKPLPLEHQSWCHGGATVTLSMVPRVVTMPCDCGAAENIAEANSLAVDAARDNVGEV